ncbi:MAG: hypothetical protein C0475_02235 [Planctomyces sp.]|nr:hypothetical protein [Planctomyces sp.]MBA4039423.1 hypothetical protein [Planctomyces sp.]MBA4120820.1 hypothetical protein [Isosphaera sp.]
MTFLTPLLAGLAAAVAVPALVLLYFLKLRRREVEVSTTYLWKKAIQDLQANAPFQKLRNNVLLILQLLALAAALLGLAQPQLRGQVSGGRRAVIAIDRSASMSSTDGDPANPGARTTRLERAKRQAREFVQSMREPTLWGGAGDMAMLVAFDTRADLLVNFTASKPELLRAIDAIAPTDAPSAFADAFAVARAHLPDRIIAEAGGAGGGEVFKLDEQKEGGVDIQLFSDGRIADLDKVRVQAEDAVTYHAVGSERSWSAGITELRAGRELDKPDTLSLFVALSSSRPEPYTVDVQLAIDGAVAGIQRATIPAAVTAELPVPTDAPEGTRPVTEVTPATTGVSFRVLRPEGGVLTATLLHPDTPDGDALRTDDVAYLILPPGRLLDVALITDGNPLVESILQAMNPSKPVRVVPTASAAAFLRSADASGLDAVVLDRWAPSAGADSPEGVLPEVPALVFGATLAAPVGPIDAGPTQTGRAEVLSWRREHPALRGVSLDALKIAGSARALSVPAGSPVLSLVDGTSGPLIYATGSGARRAVVVAFDPLQTTWPWDIGYVLFTAKALQFLAGTDDESAPYFRPGQTLAQRLPPEATGVRLVLPDNQERPVVPAPTGEVTYGPIERIGVYTLSWDGVPGPRDVRADGRSRRAVAVNLADQRESAIQAAPTLLFGSRVVSAQAGQSIGALRLWPWALLVCLGVIVLEWWVYNKKMAL